MSFKYNKFNKHSIFSKFKYFLLFYLKLPKSVINDTLPKENINEDWKLKIASKRRRSSISAYRLWYKFPANYANRFACPNFFLLIAQWKVKRMQHFFQPKWKKFTFFRNARTYQCRVQIINNLSAYYFRNYRRDSLFPYLRDSLIKAGWCSSKFLRFFKQLD